MTSEFLGAPPAAEEGVPRRGRRRRRTPVWVALLLALALALAAAWGVHRVMAPGFPASDSRACAGSTEPLEQQARGVGLVLPPGTARHLQYLSAGPDRLMLSFSLGQQDLRGWLSANKLPAPVRDVTTDLPGPPCGSLEDGFADPVSAETLLPSGDRLSVAVDPDGVPAAPALPAVHVQVSPADG